MGVLAGLGVALDVLAAVASSCKGHDLERKGDVPAPQIGKHVLQLCIRTRASQ